MQVRPGVRTGPIEGGYDWHPGIDIAVDFGTPVYATAAGTVEQAGPNGGYVTFCARSPAIVPLTSSFPCPPLPV